jgi:hypothetical protein
VKAAVVSRLPESSRRSLPFVIHPFSNEIRAGDDSEFPVLTVDQVEESVAVQFLQQRETQQRPQMALDRGTNKLVQILQMTLEQLSGYSNSDVIIRGSIATFHNSPRAGRSELLTSIDGPKRRFLRKDE